MVAPDTVHFPRRFPAERCSPRGCLEGISRQRAFLNFYFAFLAFFGISLVALFSLWRPLGGSCPHPVPAHREVGGTVLIGPTGMFGGAFGEPPLQSFFSFSANPFHWLSGCNFRPVWYTLGWERKDRLPGSKADSLLFIPRVRTPSTWQAAAKATNRAQIQRTQTRLILPGPCRYTSPSRTVSRRCFCFCVALF